MVSAWGDTAAEDFGLLLLLPVVAAGLPLLEADSKEAIVCGTPSSRTVKSSFVRFVTGLPLRSFTTASKTTKFALVRKVTVGGFAGSCGCDWMVKKNMRNAKARRPPVRIVTCAVALACSETDGMGRISQGNSSDQVGRRH